jgi:hypothetical protein
MALEICTPPCYQLPFSQAGLDRLTPAACQGQEAAPSGGMSSSQRSPASLGKQGAWKIESVDFYKVVTTVWLYVIKPKYRFPTNALVR